MNISQLIYCNEEFPCYTFSNLCHKKRSLEFGIKLTKSYLMPQPFNVKRPRNNRYLVKVGHETKCTMSILKM